jgi:hypothetical protein
MRIVREGFIDKSKPRSGRKGSGTKPARRKSARVRAGQRDGGK